MMINKYSFLFLIFCIPGFTLQAQTGHYTKTEEKVIRLVAALPEVKKLARTFADTAEHFEIIIAETPIAGFNYYTNMTLKYNMGNFTLRAQRPL